MYRVAIGVSGGVIAAASGAVIGAFVERVKHQHRSLENEILKYKNEELRDQIQKLQVLIQAHEGKIQANHQITDVPKDESTRRVDKVAKNRVF